jgi:hypothetical protein
MAERRTVGNDGHVLLQEKSLHVLKGEFLTAVRESAAGNPCADLVSHLEHARGAQGDAAIHRDLNLAGHHAQVDE